MSDGSDIEMQSALPKKTKKPPKMPKSPSVELLNQEPKKVTTKVMIHEALIELKKSNRKGASLYAIKKHIAEKHVVDIEKLNYIIKKLIKNGVETGTILQTKGIGATGSFRLAPEKKQEKKSKLKKIGEKKKKTAEKSEKTKGKKDKEKVNTEKPKENDDKKPMKKKIENAKTKTSKVATKKGKKESEGVTKGRVQKAKLKAKNIQTPAKKRAAMMKRKSIGSIIKPPKMKPTAKA